MISRTLDRIEFEGLPLILENHIRGAMETMHFHIAHTNSFRTTSFRIQGVPMNNLAPIKIVLGGGGGGKVT